MNERIRVPNQIRDERFGSGGVEDASTDINSQNDDRTTSEELPLDEMSPEQTDKPLDGDQIVGLYLGEPETVKQRRDRKKTLRHRVGTKLARGAVGALVKGLSVGNRAIAAAERGADTWKQVRYNAPSYIPIESAKIFRNLADAFKREQMDANPERATQFLTDLSKRDHIALRGMFGEKDYQDTVLHALRTALDSGTDGDEAVYRFCVAATHPGMHSFGDGYLASVPKEIWQEGVFAALNNKESLAYHWARQNVDKFFSVMGGAWKKFLLAIDMPDYVSRYRDKDGQEDEKARENSRLPKYHDTAPQAPKRIRPSSIAKSIAEGKYRKETGSNRIFNRKDVLDRDPDEIAESVMETQKVFAEAIRNSQEKKDPPDQQLDEADKAA